MLSTFLGLEFISPLSLQIAIAAVWVLADSPACLGSKSFRHSNPEIVRKIVHIGIGHVILLAWWLDIPRQYRDLSFYFSEWNHLIILRLTYSARY